MLHSDTSGLRREYSPKEGNQQRGLFTIFEPQNAVHFRYEHYYQLRKEEVVDGHDVVSRFSCMKIHGRLKVEETPPQHMNYLPNVYRSLFHQNRVVPVSHFGIS